MSVVIAIDAGTTGVRAIAFDRAGHVGGLVVPGVPPALPPARAGSSTTPTEIWAGRADDARRARRRRCRRAASPPSASPTSARRPWCGTARTGAPVHRAIVWQDRRTAARCDELRDAGHLALVRAHHRPGARPVLLGHQARVAASPRAASSPTTDLAFGTIDSWLLWKLTGGSRAGAVHATDVVQRQPHDAVRHPRRRRGRPSCATCSACPTHVLPEVRPSSGRFGVTGRRPCRRRRRHPDQRHRRRPAGGAVRPGLLRAGHDQEHLRHRLVRADERGRRPAPSRSTGLLTTVAWTIPAALGGRRIAP